MLGNNLLEHRQGFEMGIKDCVLTKKERVSFSFAKTQVWIFVYFLFMSEEKLYFILKITRNYCRYSKPHGMFWCWLLLALSV